MKKRKKVPEKRQMAWQKQQVERLKQRVGYLEEKTLRLGNRLHTESYFWQHDKKEVVGRMKEILAELKRTTSLNHSTL